MTPKSQMNASWYADPSRGSVPNSFNLFQEQFLKPLGKTAVNIEREKESAEYGSVRFEMDGQTCLYRQAKHTPKKVGQFAALWKRPAMSGEIAPFDYDDGIDRVIILVGEHPRFGVFVFPRQLLVEKDIFSEKSIGENARFGFTRLGLCHQRHRPSEPKFGNAPSLQNLRIRPKGWRN